MHKKNYEGNSIDVGTYTIWSVVKPLAFDLNGSWMFSEQWETYSSHSLLLWGPNIASRLSKHCCEVAWTAITF
jgi:hypothetical protein